MPFIFPPNRIHMKYESGDALEQNLNFIPILDDTATENEPGESQEEYFRRRAKEFNELTQSDPDNVDNWMRFAAFQDEYMIFIKSKRKIAPILEKKMSVSFIFSSLMILFVFDRSRSTKKR